MVSPRSCHRRTPWLLTRCTLPVLLAVAFAAWAAVGVTPTAAQTPTATPIARQTVITPAPTPRRANPGTVQHGSVPDLSAPLPVGQAALPGPSPVPTEAP